MQRVADARRVRAYGAVTTVARQMNLDPRLVQKWVTKATAPIAPQPCRPAADSHETYLPQGLLHCGFCQQPMAHAESHDSGQGYQCQQGCRPRPLDGVAVADTVGRAILARAARTIPSTSTPTPPHLAAVHAHRVLARVTVGATPSDVTLTWRATSYIAEVVGPEGRLVSIDIDPEVIGRATTALDVTGYSNRVRVLVADAEHGVPDEGPFDAIIVTVGAWDIAPAWLDQLAQDGMLVLPPVMNNVTRVVAFRRDGDHLGP